MRSLSRNHAPKCSLPNCTTQVGYHKGYVKKDGLPTWKWKTFWYLGWICRDPLNTSLTIDHHDGDKLNTSEANLKVLCANCHQKKTKAFGDNKKRYSYTNRMFSDLFEEV